MVSDRTRDARPGRVRAQAVSPSSQMIAPNQAKEFEMKITKSLILALTIGLFLSTFAMAEDEPSEQVKRLDASAAVLDEIMGTPDKGIPEEILGSAECVAVIPSMVKIGFIFGGRHGRGLATVPHQIRMERPRSLHRHRRQLGTSDRRRSG